MKQKQIEWNKLIEYAARFHNNAAVKRLGFILEIQNLALDYLPELIKIISLGEHYVLLDPNHTKSGKYVSRWKIQLNINVDELKAGV